MTEEMYMNKRGFRCVRLQLVKTDGRDPQEYERAKTIANGDDAVLKTEVGKLKVVAQEFA